MPRGAGPLASDASVPSGSRYSGAAPKMPALRSSATAGAAITGAAGASTGATAGASGAASA